MSTKNLKPWPHSPGVIVVVEHVIDSDYPACVEVERSYEVRIFGRIVYSASYDDAVEFCIDEKRAKDRVAARRENVLISEYGGGQRVPELIGGSLADEMGV